MDGIATILDGSARGGGATGAYRADRHLLTGEPAEVAAAARSLWDGDVYRIAPGPFRFEGRRVPLGEGCAAEAWRSEGAARARLRLAAESVHVCFLEGETLRLAGRRIPGPAMAVTVAGASFEASFRGTAMGVGVSIATARLPGVAELLLRWRARAAGETVLTPIDSAAAALRARLQSLLAADLGAGADEAAAARVLDAACRALAQGVDAPDPRAVAGGKRRHALAAAAEELIWRRVNAPEPGDTSLDALCAELGTTRRTLQLAFQEHFGVNFGLVARAARLHRVRDELRAGSASVSDAAFRQGFEHFGRFAGYYRAFYGENPSTTRRANAR